MGWVTIIAGILQIFGPFIAAWMKKCIEDLLKEAAADLPAPKSFGSEGEAVAAVFDAAIAKLPRRAFVRRKALARMKQKAVVNGKLRRTPLSAAEAREARVLAARIRR